MNAAVWLTHQKKDRVRKLGCTSPDLGLHSIRFYLCLLLL